MLFLESFEHFAALLLLFFARACVFKFLSKHKQNYNMTENYYALR